jgi:hypothetical protein
MPLKLDDASAATTSTYAGLSLTGTTPLSVCTGPCYVSPFVIVSHVGTSCTDLSVGAACTIYPYIDSPKVRRG